MQNLLDTYDESSNSSHISIESDKQTDFVDVDETSTVQEHRDTRKHSETASKDFQATNTNFQIFYSCSEASSCIFWTITFVTK